MHKTKEKLYLFTDGSVHPQSGIGFGAYLLLDSIETYSAEMEKKVVLKKFDDTSSTKLELETLLCALEELDLKENRISIYTDCQNIIGLEARRERFEKNNYITAKGTLIKNHELYKEFYKKMDVLDSVFIKVKGHKKASTKDMIDDIFTLVDTATRKALRETL